MTVQYVIDLAKTTKLNNLAVKDDTETILGYLNLGVLELYKRFPLSVKEYLLELQNGVTVYTMPSDYMWLIAAYDEVPEESTDTVNVLPINTEDNPLSINTISWNQIQIPVVTQGAFISLIYAASPTLYSSLNLNADVEIPPQMLEALLNYISYCAQESLGGNENAEDGRYYQKFEASCDRILKSGMYTPDDLDMQARDLKGFV